MKWLDKLRWPEGAVRWKGNLLQKVDYVGFEADWKDAINLSAIGRRLSELECQANGGHYWQEVGLLTASEVLCLSQRGVDKYKPPAEPYYKCKCGATYHPSLVSKPTPPDKIFATGSVEDLKKAIEWKGK